MLILAAVAPTIVGLVACGDDSASHRTFGALAPVEERQVPKTRWRSPPRGGLVPDRIGSDFYLDRLEEGVESFGRSHVTLYGDPEADDPLAGTWVAVTYEPAREHGPFLPGDGRGVTPDPSAPIVQGELAWVGRIGSVEWVTWPLPPDDAIFSDHVLVVARGLARRDVLAISESVHVLDGDRPVATSLPKGMEAIASASLSLPGLLPSEASAPERATVFRWYGRSGGELMMFVVGGDAPLANLVRLAVDDLGGTEVRGHRGAVGPPILSPGRVGDQMPAEVIRTWLEDGMVVYVGASGVPDDEVDRFVESLRPLRSGDIERLRDEATRDPASIPSSGDVAVSGRVEGGYWQVSAKQLRNASYLLDAKVRYIDGRSGGGGGGGSGPTGFAAGEFLDEAGALIYGTAPREAGRVQLVLRDGFTIEPELHDLGTTYPVRFFGTWVEGKAQLERASAYTAEGRELSRVTLERPLSDREGVFAIGQPPTP